MSLVNKYKKQTITATKLAIANLQLMVKRCTCMDTIMPCTLYAIMMIAKGTSLFLAVSPLHSPYKQFHNVVA